MRLGRLQAGESCCVHATHGCHNRQFLLRFARDRRSYVNRLREMSQRYPVQVLDYMVTSNHVHLVHTAYQVREHAWTEAAAVGSQAWVEGLAERIVVGRKAVVPLAPVPASQTGIADASGSYALHASRRTFDPLRLRRTDR